ncbi:MAG: U32 family peptidase [Lachnospiraceae bacterium]|nr:U32 family peptidase [Lachnospiraceae bacterium]
MSRKVELLAPAGNPEGFYGAIHAGADAVYLAGNRFGARAYADNFTTEELVACIRYAHIWGRRVYLTVNTLVKESEFDELMPYLTPFYEAGLDGVIVQDIGVFCFIKEHFPGMELHVSTQMTLTGQYGAAFLKKMGAVRIVPARELSLNELVEIKEQTGLEIETFIHGAMCYCYSGQCLFSSILGGRSGNRGRCAQPCRLPYKVNNNNHSGKECYPLSLKDMCTIEHIPELIAAGIDSFKIEGRMKKPEYAAGVTAIYRKYIDKYYAGEDCHVSRKDLDALGKLYIRSERQDGYYYRHNSKDMVTIDSPSYSGTDETLLASVRERYLNTKPVIKLNIQAKFCVGEPASVTFSLFDNANLKAEVLGDVVSSAMKQPISQENIHKQLCKLGETVFVADSVQIEADSNAFYPLKAINELRRQAVLNLENCIIGEYGLCSGRQMPTIHVSANQDLFLRQSFESNHTDLSYNCGNMHISVSTQEQLNALCKVIVSSNTEDLLPTRVYIEADCLYNAKNTMNLHVFEQCKELLLRGCEPVIALPPILRKRDDRYLNTVWEIYKEKADLFKGFLIRSMEGLGFLEYKGYGLGDNEAVYTDAGFYIWNSQSLESLIVQSDADTKFSAKISGFCLPYELKASEQRQLLKKISAAKGITIEKVVYGRIPLMITANCVVNTTSGCDRNSANKVCYLTDRYNKQFPVMRNCIHCMNTIYNSLPLSLHQEYSKWAESVDFRVDFTIENEQETGRILQYFLSGARGQTPYAEYTTGHEKRGAE